MLQPLSISTKVWTDISMDFIEGLSNSNGYTIIMVVVDRLSKYVHFVHVSHPYTSSKITQLILTNILKSHGMSLSIITGRDPIFTS